MAHEYTAFMHMALVADTRFDKATAPFAAGGVTQAVENATNGQRWTAGSAAGQVDAVYRRERTVGSGATDAYNVLAAGSLETPAGEAVDLDECKAIMVRCTAGSIKVVGGTSNPMFCFTGSGEGVVLTAGQSFGLDLGPFGIDVTTNSTFEVIEATSGGPATYQLGFIGAE